MVGMQEREGCLLPTHTHTHTHTGHMHRREVSRLLLTSGGNDLASMKIGTCSWYSCSCLSSSCCTAGRVRSSCCIFHVHLKRSRSMPTFQSRVRLPSLSRRLQQMREQRMLTVLHGVDGGAHGGRQCWHLPIYVVDICGNDTHRDAGGELQCARRRRRRWLRRRRRRAAAAAAAAASPKFAAACRLRASSGSQWWSTSRGSDPAKISLIKSLSSAAQTVDACKIRSCKIGWPTATSAPTPGAPAAAMLRVARAPRLNFAVHASR